MTFAPRSVTATVGVARAAVIAIYLLLFAALLGVLLYPRKATAVSPANTEKK